MTYKFILYDCPCYSVYADENQFCELIRAKQSYFACCVKPNGSVLHKKFPIMIGSLLDYYIRKDKMFENQKQFGAFLIRGEVVIIPNFLTNNTNGLHTRKRYNTRIATFSFPDTENQNVTYTIKYRNDALKQQDGSKMQKLDDDSSDDEDIDMDTSTVLSAPTEDVEFQKDTSDDIDEGLLEDDEEDEVVITRNRKRKFKEDDWTGMKFESLTRLEGTLRSEHGIMKADDIKNILSSFYTTVNLDKIRLDDYEYVMKKMIEYPLELDSFSNKIILSPSTILAQCYNVLANDDKISRLEDIMKKGTMFFILSKSGYNSGGTLKLNDNTVKTSLYTVMSGSKQNNIASQLRLVKRSVTEAMKKTTALNFSEDANGFICPLTSKELVGAGEMMELAQYVTITTPISIDMVREEVEKISKPIDTFDEVGNDEYIILYGDFITYRSIKKDMILTLKKQLPFCAFFIHDNILRINYTGNIPVKFSPKYNVFISSHERNVLWKDAFDMLVPITNFGHTIQYMGDKFYRVSPAKATVFQANCKGSMTVFNTDDDDSLMRTIFKTTGGYHVAMILKPDLDISKFAHIHDRDVGQNTKVTQPIVNKLFENCKAFVDNYKNFDFMSYSNDYIKTYKDYLPDQKDAIKAFKVYVKMLLKYKSVEFILKVSSDSKTKPISNFQKFIKKYDLKGIYAMRLSLKGVVAKETKKHNIFYYMPRDICKNFSITIYYKIIEQYENNPEKAYQLQLYAAFGDIDGGTVEDGIIADVDFIKNSPNIYTSSSSRVALAKNKEVKLTKNDLKEICYTPINKAIDNQIIYGSLTTKFRLYIKSNDNVKIKEINIKGVYKYMIYSTNYVDGVQIESYMVEDSVIVSYNIMTKIGIGTKLANNFGQKDVICKIADLSPFGGYNIKGEFIKPQILYPPQSLIGRSVGCQYISAIESPDLVITMKSKLNNPLYRDESGNLMVHKSSVFGKVNIVVHNQGPLSKLQSTRSMKNDLWTNENGFRCNQLASLPVAVEGLNPKNKCYNKRNVRSVNEIFTLQGLIVDYADVDM